ncbi:MAG: family 2 glycosyl transferase [Clostridium sp.]|nr:family 2 glycosyl transferase [Lachnoclostridium sp.]MCM1252282.1 family 2 glycosyl transferase [Clostridium sp.]
MKKINVGKILLSTALIFLLTGCESEYGRMIYDMQDKSETAVEKPQKEEEQEEEPEADKIQTFAPEHIVSPYVVDDASFYYKADGKYLSVYNGEEFEELYLKGVNLGLGKPGYFPGETAITKAEYAAWFKQISEMNANCIRVYTIQPPSFYEAFYEFNQTAKEPLYLFHGTWYDETRLVEAADAFDEQLYAILQQDMRNLVDVLHGNCTIAPQPGKASGIYRYDISSYVIGWILGIESDAEFVSTTNANHPEIHSYEGTYICADNLEPFEVFWAQTGDYILSYEMENYGMQRPLSYSNWPTADILEHPSETMAEEYSVDLNVENLRTTDAFVCGLFASYHIYPYYPNFLYTQKEYIDYRDEDGNHNTYKPYLEELIAKHNIPVVVAEFGIPVSRGMTHSNIYTGFDQGNKTEEEQGEMLTSMMEDIHDTGYAGGIIFTWQDEWFKRTWNTEEYTNPNRRAYWYDVMTCEQHFGLLDFVPGEENTPTVVLDGDDNEWSDDDILLETGDASLSVKHDCAYLYLMVKKQNADYDTEKLIIPFDVTPHSGSYVYEENRFDHPADFVMIIDGKENSQLLVHSYYDLYQFEYDKHDKEITTTQQMKEPDNDLFQPLYFFVERELILQDRAEIIPVQKFPAGELVYGISDYDADGYNSLADFYYDGDILEIRIPWLMLNFRDPSRKEIEGDFWANEWFCEDTVDGIRIGLSDGNKRINMKEYQWENWDYYPYFERLRKSYYMIQEQFKTLAPVTTS